MKTLKKQVKVIYPDVSQKDDLPEINIMRVCAYCRVSTEQEIQQSSIEMQKSHYRKHISKNPNWEFVGIYADNGITGTSTKNRERFLEMMKDAKAGKIDLILTKSISRFARNTLDCLNYVRLLKNLPSPVGIYFERENLNTLDSTGELMLTILSSIYQEESRSTSENIKWAYYKRFKKGIVPRPSKSFLGYDSDETGNYVINEEQAQIVRRIYAEFLEGKNRNRIAKGLTRDGIRTSRGKQIWNPITISEMIKNEKYCGDVILSKTVTEDYLTHKQVKNTGQQPQYYIANHHPAIISREDWNEAQRILKRKKNNKVKANKKSNRKAFSEVLICSKCGYPLICKTSTIYRNDEKILVKDWKCKAADGKLKGKSCEGGSISETYIEHTFMKMLNDMKNNIEAWMDDAKAFIAANRLSDEERVRMDQIKEEFEMLGDFPDEMDGSYIPYNPVDILAIQRLANLKEEELAREELSQLERKDQEWVKMMDDFAWFISELEQLSDFYPNTERIEFRLDIYERLVKKGIVGDDDGVVDYRLLFGARKVVKGER